MIKLTIEWASVADRRENDAFNAERAVLLDRFMKENKSTGVIGTPKDSPIGIIMLSDEEAAKEWEVAIRELAQKYQKHISYIVTESV